MVSEPNELKQRWYHSLVLKYYYSTPRRNSIKNGIFLLFIRNSFIKIPHISLASTLSLPRSCQKHVASKIKNLVEYSFIPESAQINERLSLNALEP